jgi:hypothetical protein
MDTLHKGGNDDDDDDNNNNNNKFHPRTDNEVPEGDQRYSCTLSLTSALDGAGGQCHPPIALPPGMTQYPLYGRLGGPLRPVWTVAENLPPPAFNPGPSRP